MHVIIPFIWNKCVVVISVVTNIHYTIRPLIIRRSDREAKQ